MSDPKHESRSITVSGGGEVTPQLHASIEEGPKEAIAITGGGEITFQYDVADARHESEAMTVSGGGGITMNFIEGHSPGWAPSVTGPRAAVLGYAIDCTYVRTVRDRL